MQKWEDLKDWLFGNDTVEVVFQERWEGYLVANLPLYARLPEALKGRLHHKIGQFVATTYFEGCGGLELTDEMILTVAGQACLLTVNHEGAPYPKLNTVLLYPSTFHSTVTERDALGIVTERKVARLGESWSNGTVVLAWDSVTHGARNIYDGHNVTFHEFAHQLDQANGHTDGVPELDTVAAFRTWAAVFSAEYANLLDKVEAGRKTVLDYYGATSISEFFAVATESFFEKPVQMEKKLPDLYAEMRAFFGINPVEWF